MTDSAPADGAPADSAPSGTGEAGTRRADAASPRGGRPGWLTSSPTTIVAVTIAVALPLIIAVATLSGRRWFPVLDLAMTEFRVRDVGGRHTPLIGLPGRIGTFPEQGSHPGPLSFYLLAPTYRLLGSSAWSMEVGTIVLAIAAIGLVLWIVQRQCGAKGIEVGALVVLIASRGYGMDTLTQP